MVIGIFEGIAIWFWVVYPLELRKRCFGMQIVLMHGLYWINREVFLRNKGESYKELYDRLSQWCFVYKLMDEREKENVCED